MQAEGLGSTEDFSAFTYHLLRLCLCVCYSVVPDSLRPPWTVACQAHLSMKVSSQESWIEQPFPSPEELPDPGIEPRSPVLQPPGKPHTIFTMYLNKLSLKKKKKLMQPRQSIGNFPSSSMVRIHLPMIETQVRTLSLEDSLE